MRRRMRVSKWGSSLAIRLPRDIVKALRLKEGDVIRIQVVGRASEVNHPSAKELLARLRKFRGRLPATFRFGRLEANQRT
jgi:antitoxin MazE